MGHSQRRAVLGFVLASGLVYTIFAILLQRLVPLRAALLVFQQNPSLPSALQVVMALFLPFGYLPQMGLDWIPPIPGIALWACAMCLSASALVVFGVVSGRHSAADLRRVSVLAAVWVVMSSAGVTARWGPLGWAWPGGSLEYAPALLLNAAWRALLTLPFALIWMVWLAPNVSARLVSVIVRANESANTDRERRM